MEIGRIGVRTFEFEQQPWAAIAEAAAELDELGYGAIWFPESRGREVMAQSALLLGATKRAVIAPGIANLYARDAMAMAAGQRALCEAYPGRFLLGIGVSHRPSVEDIRGHTYGPPIATMRAYLDAMDAAPYLPPRAESEPRVLAALGPRMLKLAAERTLGAHPYFVPVEHTAVARQTMGDGPLLAPEQAVVLERDPARAREVARHHMTRYLAAENYANNLRRLGFTDADVANGGSDKLVDAIVAWGGLEDVTARVQAHLDAGADHVCIQVLATEPGTLPKQAWRELASALIS
jgi:probable F420-dependent oxidoreductase